MGRGKAERGPNACARGRLSAYPQVLQPVGQQLHIRLRGPALGLDLDHHARALRRIAEDLVRQIGRLRFRRRLRCLCHGAGKPTLSRRVRTGKCFTPLWELALSSNKRNAHSNAPRRRPNPSIRAVSLGAHTLLESTPFPLVGAADLKNSRPREHRSTGRAIQRMLAKTT